MAFLSLTEYTISPISLPEAGITSVEWLIPGILRPGALAVICGNTSYGVRHEHAIRLAADLTAGEFAGKAIQARHVLYAPYGKSIDVGWNSFGRCAPHVNRSLLRGVVPVDFGTEFAVQAGTKALSGDGVYVLDGLQNAEIGARERAPNTWLDDVSAALPDRLTVIAVLGEGADISKIPMSSRLHTRMTLLDLQDRKGRLRMNVSGPEVADLTLLWNGTGWTDAAPLGMTENRSRIVELFEDNDDVLKVADIAKMLGIEAANLYSDLKLLAKSGIIKKTKFAHYQRITADEAKAEEVKKANEARKIADADQVEHARKVAEAKTLRVNTPLAQFARSRRTGNKPRPQPTALEDAGDTLGKH